MNVTIDTVTTGSQPSTGTEGCLENINGVCLINYGTAAQKRSGPKMAGTQRSMTRSPTSRKRSRLKKPSWESLFPETLDTSDVCRSACGACLLEIDDEALQDEGVGDTACASSSSLSNSEKTSDVPVAALPILGILNGCRHAFHASCIQTWAQRDSFCPQCKQRFNAIGLYTREGVRISFEECPLLYFGETLTDDDDNDASDEEPLAENNPPARRRRRRAGATRRPPSSPSRSSDTVRLSPERLAEHRLRVQMRQRIERERRQRLCERVTAAQARSTIEQSLARLPYQPALVKPLVATHDDTSDVAERSAFHDIPSTTACPKSTARPRVPIASIIRRRKSSEAPVANTSATPRSASSSFGDFCLVPPRYHKDFLLS